MPNLHPIFVHFPIAWFVTALGCDVACIAWRRKIWLDRGAVTFYFLSAIGAGAAIGTGTLAARSVPLTENLQAVVGQHGEWAFFTFVAFVLVALLRLEATWRDRGRSEIRLSRVRSVALVASAIASWLLYETAERGASLVFRYGIAVGKDWNP